jgi:hypothetical protein
MPPPQSPEEKAQKEEVRGLTAQALSASTPEEAVRVNRQILLINPGDFPAQQRLDKAQEKIDRAAADRDKAARDQQGVAAQAQANQVRRDALLRQIEESLIQGRPDQAKTSLNDAERLGAAGPEVSRLRAIILDRLRSRLLTRIGLGSLGLFGLAGFLAVILRRRGRKLTPFLVAIDGVDKGKRYLLNQDVTHIGAVAMDAGKKNEILVRDPDRKVSRFHCEVHKRGDALYVIDLNSSNGTFLRNRRLQPGVAVRVRDGHRIALGNAVELEVRVERMPINRN